MELLMIMRQKMNSIHLLQKDQKMGSGWNHDAVGVRFDF